MAVFGKSPEEGTRKITAEMINRINDNIRRLRVIEQSMKALDTRVNSLEQEMLAQTNATQKSLGERDVKIAELGDKIAKLETLVKEVVKQIKLLATKSNIEELKQLVDIYNPLKSNFVTREEAERLIEKGIKEKG